MPGQDISLFPRYSQQENRTTNYTLLLCRLLYEESPALYGEFLEALLPGAGLTTMPSFRQQEKVKGSVLDGVISQPSYTMFIETKRHDDFHDAQMRSHLAALAARSGDVRVLIALSSFAATSPAAVEARFQAMADEIGAAAPSDGGRLKVVAVSFEDFLAALPTFGAETAFARIVTEYRAYLADEGLLGSWRTLLDVVPIRTWPHHVTDLRVYSCPTTGGAYRHQRCAYFGSYRYKRVTHIAAIRGLVRLQHSGEAEVMWQNDLEAAPADLIATARERATAAWGRLHEDLQVFVLDEPHATDFRKQTPGGLRARAYIDLARLTPAPGSAAELAARLHGRRWDEVK